MAGILLSKGTGYSLIVGFERGLEEVWGAGLRAWRFEVLHFGVSCIGFGLCQVRL